MMVVEAAIHLRSKEEVETTTSQTVKRSTAAMADYMLMQPLMPAMSGSSLRLALTVSESFIGRTAISMVVSNKLPQVGQILRCRTYQEEPRATAQLEGASPEDEVEVHSTAVHDRLEAALHSLGYAGTTLVSTAANTRPTVLDYHYAFEHGMITPNAVAERVIAFLERHNGKEHYLVSWSADDIRQQAAAATARYAAGASLSVFDGVPFCVKDSVDALPYETTYGTKFMAKLQVATEDAPCVATLKQLGAMLVGKAAMNEFGALGHGCNAHTGSPRNPHDPTKITGGSSAGSAAAVAVGLCPIAIGTDGGGSIRIPASYCGVVGLKPSMGRLADDHGAHGGFSSMIVSGPIANSVADLLLLYAAMANTDYPAAVKSQPKKTSLPGAAAAAAAAAAASPRLLGLPQELLPLLHLGSELTGEFVLAGAQPLKGLRIGIFQKWVSDCSVAVAGVLKQAMSRLEALGATMVDINIPDLDLCQVGHIASFLKELAADGEQQGWLNDWSLRSQLNLDTRMFFCNATNFSDEEYTQAQRIRARVQGHFLRAFEQCDVILTPATPTTAPPRTPEADTTGVYDLASTLETIRYSQAANFTGLPALVMPGGRQLGMLLPVGIQFIGKPWGESTLLRTAAALEQQMLEEGVPRPLPGLSINPIQCEKGVHPKARELTQKLWSKRYGKKGGGEDMKTVRDQA